ncbi:MAG: hypothetical protein D6731_06450 [Planctomycetota bacterium]|nr:MAG: hypothetical protein D6731_06450 [Planctomycetota bacterium]
MDEIKRVFRNVFTRDVRAFEPNRTGLVIGENLRIYKEGPDYLVSFLRGTDRAARKQTTDRLDQAGVRYRLGPDFRL